MCSRENIVSSIIEAIKDEKFIYAAWQGGAIAFNRVDQWSDIDLIIDTDEDKFDEVFNIIERTLNSISKIKHSFGSIQPIVKGAFQKIYKLKDTSDYLFVEICLLPHTGKEKLLELEIHGNPVIHFDKTNVTVGHKIDNDEFAEMLERRLGTLINIYEIYQYTINKELNRGNYGEAFAFYFAFSLNPLIEILRMRYSPYHYNFRSRYIYYELPNNIVQKLQKLYFVSDHNDLEYKHKQISEWFEKEKTFMLQVNFKQHLQNYKNN